MKGGIIVRLIDVVFILLLGFISASDIIRKTQIKLPPQLTASTGGQEVREPRPLVIRIFVQKIQDLTPELLKIINSRLRSVGKKGMNEKNRLDQRLVSERFVAYSVRTGVTDEDLDETITTTIELEMYIIQQIQERLEPGQKVMVVIMPDPEVMVQGVVNIFDICRRYKIEYHIKYPRAHERLKEFLQI